MTRTRKPCPGCKQVIGRRAADDVCRECKELMAEATAQRQRQAEDKLSVRVMLPFHYYSLPYIKVPDREVLQTAFFDLMLLITTLGSSTLDYENLIEGQQSGRRIEDFRLMPRDTLEAVRTLYASIQAACERAHAEGKSEGRSLILGLATGEVSLADFNRASVGDEE